MRYRLPAFLVATFLSSGHAFCEPAVASAPSSQTESAQLKQLLDEQWAFTLKNSPELATIVGDERYNHLWSDVSAEHAEKVLKINQEFLKKFESIPRTHLSDQEILSLDMMIRQLKDRIEYAQLKLWEMPVDQFNGIQISLPGFISSIPFKTVKNYEEYIERLKSIPKILKDTEEVCRIGMKDKLMQPRFLLEKAAQQAASIAGPVGTANVFGMPALNFPSSIPVADQKRLKTQIIQAVNNDVRPAYKKFAQFLKEDYAPNGRVDEGIWALPGGDDIYRFDVRSLTTTTKTPEEIHAIGLAQVEKIEADMTEIAHKLGFADLASLRKSVQTDKKLYAKSPDEILELYRHYIAQMQPELPKLFGILPKTPLEVRPVEAYRENEAADAEYHQGTPDGSRPGIVFVNTGDYAKRDIYTIEDTAYHEGVPGHHLQIAIAQTMPVPAFRQQGDYTAYIEGWALYAEHLGKDIGFYKDLYNDYGRLNGELLRADRLVLDTGVHAMHWDRKQMIDFFRAHPAESEPGMEAEVDRYIAWPAQALGYMLGQQTILNLREEAKKELGDKFDIRKFHDAVLSGGAMPLDMLETRIKTWIVKEKASH